MECKNIIMNHSVPPSLEDLGTIAAGILQSMPDELLRHCDGVAVIVEDIVDEAMLADLNLDDPFDLLALYKNGKEISPGIVRKVANDDDVLIIYRRALLDMWCETEEDLQSIIRQVMIEEIGRYFELSENDVQDMADQDYQGVL